MLHARALPPSGSDVPVVCVLFLRGQRAERLADWNRLQDRCATTLRRGGFLKKEHAVYIWADMRCILKGITWRRGSSISKASAQWSSA